MSYRNDYLADVALVDALTGAWRSASAQVLGQAVDGPIAGTAVVTPMLVEIVLGPPTRLLVEMLPGQLPSDYRAAARRLAPHLGGAMLRVQPVGLRWVELTVLDVDPLGLTLPLDLYRPGLLLGRDEGGLAVDVDHPRDLPHMIVQGQTRSGKSIFLYSLLSQAIREPDIEVAGVDPSGITLRPLPGRWVANGLADPERIVYRLTELVAEMDARLARMPWDRDILPTDTDTPVVVIVLDEYPALLRALDGLKSPKSDPGKVVRTLVARMLAESHKVGFRVVLCAQRAEAQIVGSAERAQCAGRLSFRVDSADSVKLLHPDADDLAVEHTTSPPGIAILSWPGRPVSRLRTPYIGTYRDYVAAVSQWRPDGLPPVQDDLRAA